MKIQSASPAYGLPGVVTRGGFRSCVAAPIGGRVDRIEISALAGLPKYGTVDVVTAEGELGGHTISRHVGKDLRALSARLQQTKHGMVSTFPDVDSAQRAVDAAFRGDKAQKMIGSWLCDPRATRLVLDVTTDGAIGQVLRRGATHLESTNDARVVLERDPRMPQGYTLLTAYPVLP